MSECCCEDIDLCAHSGANCCKHDAILAAEGYSAAATDARTIHDAARIARLEADLAAALAKLAAARLALAAVRDVRLEGRGLSNLEAGSTQPAP